MSEGPLPAKGAEAEVEMSSGSFHYATSPAGQEHCLYACQILSVTPGHRVLSENSKQNLCKGLLGWRLSKATKFGLMKTHSQ